ncbi:MAG: SCO family protein [Opitutaceae bacterium]
MTGCGSHPSDGDAEGAKGGYELVGRVVAVDPEARTALIDHEEIPQYMPAMVMEFSISEGDLKVLKEGMRLRGRMFATDDGYRLEKIWPIDAEGEAIVGQAGAALRQDTVIRGRNAYREIGESLPDFALYDQNAGVVQPDRFRGQQIVLNFIFTRCPDPKMCPASTAKMMQLQAAARELGIDNLQLISITLDPEYDTPGILNAYASSRGIDTANFSFLTGPEPAILDLMSQLGVLAFPEDGLIRHTLATILIDEKGRIIYRTDTSGWEPEEFLKRLRRPETDPARPS